MLTSHTKFGLNTSYDLFEKLKYDSRLLLRNRPENKEEQKLEEYEAFNFFVTAWHLHTDWLTKSTADKPVYADSKISKAHPYIKEVRQAIRDIANGSKHFALNDAAKVSVGAREVSSIYAYFFGPQYSINTKSFHFLLYELVGIIMDYFTWIFDDESHNSIPSAILEKLETARTLRTARKKHVKSS